MSSDESGVNGEGLATIVLPASSAGASFHDRMASGKFQRRDRRDHAERPPRDLDLAVLVVEQDLGLRRQSGEEREPRRGRLHFTDGRLEWLPLLFREQGRELLGALLEARRPPP